MKNWKLVSPFLSADAIQSLNIACDAVAAPGQPLSTSTSSSCATELATIYSQAKTSGGKAAFAGWDYRRMEPAYALAAQLLSGYSAAEAKQMAKSALEESITAPQGTKQSVGTVNDLTAWMRVYDQIRDLIETLRANGFDVWIISASPQPVVEAAAERVGISADHVIGIRGVERAGKLTYDLQGCGDVVEGMNTGTANVGNSMITYIDGKRCWLNKVVWGDTTAAAVQRTADAQKRQAFAAGDSDTDITFLQDTTGLRLAINRNKKEIMCNAYRNAHGTWLVNPMFIAPLAKLTSAYACSTTACKDSAGMGVPCRDEDGAVIPDQSDGVFAP
jgi:phosphoserine phosphatase